MSQTSDWVKARLPDDVSFSKNGVTLTIDQAITAALTFWADKREPWLWAAWDLWDQIAGGNALTLKKSESLDGYSYTVASIEVSPKRAEYYKKLADDSEAVAEAEADVELNTFQNVAATWGPRGACDENSR